MAGCLRTAWARATDRDFGPELAALPVAGPLLLASNHRILVPKPADALYFGHGADARCVRAAPRRFEDGSGADLPDGLLPVQLNEPVAGKPGDGPTWWSWDDLIRFRRGELPSHGALSGNGWTPPPGDRRTHVAIAPDTGAADAGRLFQTEGLDLELPPVAFGRSPAARGCAEAPPPRASDDRGPPASGSRARAGGLRLLARGGESLPEALVHLGGKRRLAALRPEPEEAWPTPSEGWWKEIAEAGGLCLTLLTPGIFPHGYRLSNPGRKDDARSPEEMARALPDPGALKYYGSDGNQPATDFDSPVPNAQVAVQGEFLFVLEGPVGWLNLAEQMLIDALHTRGAGAKTRTGYGVFGVVPSGMELSPEVATAPRCEWVDRTIAELSRRHNSPEETALRGKGLADAWSAIEDPALKESAYRDIRARWEAKGWWEDIPRGRSAKAAKAIYDDWPASREALPDG